MKKSIGIDIAKSSFEISVYDGVSFNNISYNTNNLRAFKKFIKDIKPDENTKFIMEPTGTYHIKMANFLHKNNYRVYLAHPFKVKNFRNMKYVKTKTDPVDARIIAEYGFTQDLLEYTPKEPQYQLLLTKMKTIEGLKKTRIALNNRIEALKAGELDEESIRSLEKIISELEKQIEKLDKECSDIINKYFKKEKELLSKIPGIGKVCTNIIIAHFEGFKNFASARQAASFIGITPCEYSSGTSVKKKPRISKCGSAYVRNMIFMGALTASSKNKSCRELYERLLKKNKSKKQALVAVAHKLLRQAFGVLKHMRPFDSNYCDERFLAK